MQLQGETLRMWTSRDKVASPVGATLSFEACQPEASWGIPLGQHLVQFWLQSIETLHVLAPLGIALQPHGIVLRIICDTATLRAALLNTARNPHRKCNNQECAEGSTDTHDLIGYPSWAYRMACGWWACPSYFGSKPRHWHSEVYSGPKLQEDAQAKLGLPATMRHLGQTWGHHMERPQAVEGQGYQRPPVAARQDLCI